jgi:NTE family protein
MKDYTEVLASAQRPKIGVVLSSGGIRPFGAIELFKFMEEAHIPIDLLVGCSGGGIIAALRGMNLNFSRMKEKINALLNPNAFANINFRTIAGILQVPFIKFIPEDAILKPEIAKQLLYDLFGHMRLEDLPIKTILQSTDADSGSGHVFTEGELDKVIYASSALMPFFPPISINQHTYVDGAFSNPLPLLEAIYREMDIIIAVDFNARKNYEPSTTLLDYYERLINESMESTTHLQNSLAVNLHHYEIIFINVEFSEQIKMWHHNRIEAIYDSARQAVDISKERIIDAITQFPHFLAKRKL